MKRLEEMREIKFRGFNEYSKQWAHGCLVVTCGESFIFSPEKLMDCPPVTSIGQFDVNYYEVIPETVGQYTGLKDCDGKDIYENDIVKILRMNFGDNRDNNIVEYEDNEGCFSLSGWQILPDMPHLYQVVGNIFDNPELIDKN